MVQNVIEAMNTIISLFPDTVLEAVACIELVPSPFNHSLRKRLSCTFSPFSRHIVRTFVTTNQIKVF